MSKTPTSLPIALTEPREGRPLEEGTKHGYLYANTAIIALGNPLRGDDAVGLGVLDTLASSGRLPQGVALLDCTRGGLFDALLMEGYRQVFIVDAVDAGLGPGEWVHFKPREVELISRSPGADLLLHNVTLPEVLFLGKALDIPLPEVEIFGVQPLELDWPSHFSEPVQEAIPSICEGILRRVIDCQENAQRSVNSHGKDTDR